MMNSDCVYTDAFVWIWLSGKTDPVVAGKLFSSGNQLLFHYGRSYLARPDAISIYEPELPLTNGVLHLPAGLNMPGSIRDSSPDAWGRRGEKKGTGELCLTMFAYIISVFLALSFKQ